MSHSALEQQFDLMGGPGLPTDVMAGGQEPPGTSPDVMAVPKRSDVMARPGTRGSRSDVMQHNRRQEGA